MHDVERIELKVMMFIDYLDIEGCEAERDKI